VFGFDIELEMVETTRRKAESAGLKNVAVLQRDCAVDGTGVQEASIDYAMLFNILHSQEKLFLLQEVWRVLKAGGKLAIIHWNHDASTPRGRSMEIRPRPGKCRSWAAQVGFELLPPGFVDLPPYYYGFVFQRSSRKE
jgi:SAM-dependent methyltransferase